jgi:thiamine biosynthesis lipoprotein
MKKHKIFSLALVALIYLLWRIFFSPPEKFMLQITGITMGTIPYSIKYFDKQNRRLGIEIDSILISYNQSLSTYISSSEISEFNIQDSLNFKTSFFYPVLLASNEIYKNSNGLFDPTIGPLVNAYGFGPIKSMDLNNEIIDSLLQNVGFNKIVFNERSVKKEHGMYLDLSAIAKGGAIDEIAEYLISKNIANYMIEIGGEVICKGLNQYSELWSIGIETPLINEKVKKPIAIAKLENRALATSGNYRNYYIKEDKLFSHTINPKTGYQVEHTLLSASIFAKNCMLADGYATACMVMGLEASKKMISELEDIDCLLIYSNENGILEIFMSEKIISKVEIL